MPFCITMAIFFMYEKKERERRLATVFRKRDSPTTLSQTEKKAVRESGNAP